MFGLFKSDPRKQLQRDYEKKLSDAMHAQRNGDIRTYSTLTAEADAIYSKLQDLEKSQNAG